MKRNRSPLTHGILFGLSALLLLAGLLIDRGLVVPRQREIRNLIAQRESLLSSNSQAAKQDMTRQELLQVLSVDDLADLAKEPVPSDPVVFLGQMLERSDLSRLELTTKNSTDGALLHRTEFSLRILGSFSGLLDFLRSLEEASRLITVDALSIHSVFGHESLEGRLNLSVYDPRPEG